MNSVDIQALNRLRERITEKKADSSISEAMTKEWLIRPFFELLGWDFSNWAEVVPEDSDEAGQRADYCFYRDRVPKLLIEAKPLRNNLNDQQMIINKLNYCSNRNIPILILTNGDTYKIFFNEISGIGTQKLLFEFTLTSNNEEEQISKLHKEYVQNDQLLNYARKVTVVKNVHSAVDQLFRKQDRELIKLVNRNLQQLLGHKFHDDEIKNALKFFHLHMDEGVSLPAVPVAVVPDKPRIAAKVEQSDSYTEEKLFKDGAWKESFNKYQLLIQHLRSTGLLFEINPKKKYIGLVCDGKNFAQVGALESELKIWVKLSFSDLSAKEKEISRDVSKIGHFGLGNVELRLKYETEFDTVAKFIRKAYSS